MDTGRLRTDSPSGGDGLSTCVALDLGSEPPLVAQIQTPRGAELARTLLSGATVSLPAFRARGQLRLRLRGVLVLNDAEAPATDLASPFEFRLLDAASHPVAVFGWDFSRASLHWIDVEQELHHAAYGEFRLQLHCNGLPGLQLSIVELVVGDLSLAAQAHALANYRARLHRELGNFNRDVYSNPLYGDTPPATDAYGSDRGVAPQQASQMHHVTAVRSQSLATVSSCLAHLRQPATSETAFAYAEYLLASSLPITAPNFFARIREACRLAHEHRRTLRVLSICSGAARVETQLLHNCEHPIELTLQDANSDLINIAMQRLNAGSHRVRCLLGDINQGLPGDDIFDIILCVSGLHHVVNVEQVFREANARMSELGEFWSIGEQIGRNGNRLWPEAREAANAIFSALPARLRKNAHTGKIDHWIDDHDYSIGSFEGVRSEELEGLLSAHFIPVDEYKRNCFLWRTVNAAYSANYDLTSIEDVRWLKRLVEAELMHWLDGGKATELHGVYRKKRIAKP